jgi:hypothetical protein
MDTKDSGDLSLQERNKALFAEIEGIFENGRN